MTQKQFKQALLRGHGSCVQAARKEPEKYRPVVVWACSRDVAFDAQCEESRSWFVYQLIGCYQDKSLFLETAVAAMKRCRSNGGWKMLYLAELLTFFAADGEETVKIALWQKYEELYSVLMNRKRPKAGIFPERDDFAMLCQVLANSSNSMVRIAEDIGRLYLQKPFYDGFDFEWLFSEKAKRYMKSLKRNAVFSENVAQYLRAGQACEEKQQKQMEDRVVSEPKSGFALSVWLRVKADKGTIEEYCENYLKQEDPLKRAEALAAFCVCPYPSQPQPVIGDARSQYPKLRETAWQVLSNIRNPLVRQFAMENLEDNLEDALPAFIMNYEQEDEQRLVDAVKSVAVDFTCTTAWHSIHIDILQMEDHGRKAPASLLRYIYENTYCSCCRLDVIRQMGRRKLLTEDILRQCLLDSNEDIRKYATRRLKLRNSTAAG